MKVRSWKKMLQEKKEKSTFKDFHIRETITFALKKKIEIVKIGR